MKKYIFGFDAARPEACAERLRDAGFDAVVVGTADAATRAALTGAGLELYLCYGAYGTGADLAGEEHLTRDAAGLPRRWFGSGCPNDAALAAARLDAALAALRETPEARGLFVDGARFASFASTEGTAAFFTCFCPRCLRRMESLGLDGERIRTAVWALSETRRVAPADAPALRDWFAFRAATQRAYFERFAGAVHALPGRPLACGFVFAPSLGGFVGQTPESWAALDVVAPMLYRAYPHADGPACLGHEWAAARELFDAETLQALAELAGIDAALIPAAGEAALKAQGFPPERVGAELSAWRERLGEEQVLSPILQIEDARREETIAAALAAGADGYGLFMYGQAEL